MVALKVEVEIAHETVTKAIVGIEADTDALDTNKLKFHNNIVDIHGEMKFAWNEKRIRIAEAHSKAASYNMY
jgi:hypothetical protein